MAIKKIKAMGKAVDNEKAAKIHTHVIQPVEEISKKVGSAVKKAAYPVTTQSHRLREANARVQGGRGIAPGSGMRSESKAAKQPISAKKAAAPKKAAAAPKKTKTTAITRKRTTK